MKITHISVSRDQCFRECPLKYKYRYHDQLPSPEPTPIYFTFGKLVHHIIEEHTKSQGQSKLEEIVVQQDLSQLNLDYRRKLATHLGNYQRLSEKIGFAGKLEYRFEIDLDPPHERYVLGFIDRLIIKDKRAWILDYKTTKKGPWRKHPGNITKDLQLQCYAWVAYREFCMPADQILAALYYLEDGQLVPVRFCQKTLESVPQYLLQSYKAIEQTDPDSVQGNPGNWCLYCDYRSICPFFRGIK